MTFVMLCLLSYVAISRVDFSSFTLPSSSFLHSKSAKGLVSKTGFML